MSNLASLEGVTRSPLRLPVSVVTSISVTPGRGGREPTNRDLPP